MKIYAQLPEAKHYRRLQNSEKIIFLDKATPLLEIESPTQNPWNKKWVILLGIKKGRNTQVTVAGKLRLRLFEQPPDQETRIVSLERSFAYGKFDYPPRDSLYHIGFPIAIINQSGEIPTYKWLQYDLYLDTQSNYSHD